MKLVHSKNNPGKIFPGMRMKQLERIAFTFSFTNRKNIFVVTRSCPHSFISKLKEYGLDVVARPLVKDRKLIGYNFLKQAA
jgi:hypothetical protein